jgi:acyl-coenzyme A thioesterase PaaI-like protein
MDDIASFRGFKIWEPSSPFLHRLSDFGNIYRRETDQVIGIRISSAHTNMHSVAHGGLLATIADCAIGNAINTRLDTAVVTVQMSLSYLSATPDGSWLEAHVGIEKRGRALIFASCNLFADDKPVLNVSSVFAIRRPL